MKQYVDPSIIERFEKKAGPFNYEKLIKQLVALNKIYNDVYASAPLIRAIIDTTPPLLGYISFEQIVSHHPWDNSKRVNLRKLLDFKNEGDSSLHTLISSKKDHIGELPPSHCLNTLLEECLNHGETSDQSKANKLILERKAPKPLIKISLKESMTSWQRYSAGRFSFYSFSVHLNIDNFNNNKSDYITNVKIEGDDGKGSWESAYFVFDDPQNPQMNPNEQLKVNAEEERDIRVLLSDIDPRSSSYEHRLRPVGGASNYKVIAQTKSRNIFEFWVKMVP